MRIRSDPTTNCRILTASLDSGYESRFDGSRSASEVCYVFASYTIKISVAEPEPVEPKLFWDLEPEPEPKINCNKHFLQSVLRMLG